MHTVESEADLKSETDAVDGRLVGDPYSWLLWLALTVIDGGTLADLADRENVDVPLVP